MTAPEQMQGYPTAVLDAECGSCGADAPTCPASKRDCGHHCNCVWTHGVCDWCGAVFGDSDAIGYGMPTRCAEGCCRNQGIGLVERPCGFCHEGGCCAERSSKRSDAASGGAR